MTAQPAFRRMAQMVSQDVFLVPLIEAYLRSAKFPKVFNVTFRDEGQERKPDGFFHPSTHPEWPERMLFYYLTEPEKMIPEEIAAENRMAMLMGTGVHDIIQVCMIDAGILLKPTGTCVCCGKTHGRRKNECNEWGAIDPVLGRRGHMDGILEIEGWGRGPFEFKTISDKATRGLEHHDLEWLKERKPGYYKQVQDYLDMTGYQKAMIVFGILGFPWRLVEIEVPIDYQFLSKHRAKYQSVRTAEKDGVLPDPCCAIGSKTAKTCPARRVCPIGKLTSA